MDEYQIQPLQNITPRGAAYDEQEDRLYVLGTRLYSINLLKKQTNIKEWSVDSPVFYQGELKCALQVTTLS
jgi:hypothetical protein